MAFVYDGLLLQHCLTVIFYGGFYGFQMLYKYILRKCMIVFLSEMMMQVSWLLMHRPLGMIVVVQF